MINSSKANPCRSIPDWYFEQSTSARNLEMLLRKQICALRDRNTLTTDAVKELSFYCERLKDALSSHNRNQHKSSFSNLLSFISLHRSLQHRYPQVSVLQVALLRHLSRMFQTTVRVYNHPIWGPIPPFRFSAFGHETIRVLPKSDLTIYGEFQLAGDPYDDAICLDRLIGDTVERKYCLFEPGSALFWTPGSFRYNHNLDSPGKRISFRLRKVKGNTLACIGY